MSDLFDPTRSSMSSRRTVCFFPSVSISSTAVFDSPASIPWTDLPSLVTTRYRRKFPSTLRLGSRRSMIRWSLGWTAMPVRSGPTWAPSPVCVWHLEHWFLNTSLPLAASPFSLVIGSSSSITFCRSGLGRAPPR